jgi:hypothetical protein
LYRSGHGGPDTWIDGVLSNKKKTRNLIYRTAAVHRYVTLDPHGWTVL